MWAFGENNLGNVINQPKNREINLDREQYKVTIKAIQELNIDLTGKVVLDYGAGNGEFAKYLVSLGAKVFVSEIDKDCQKVLKNKGFNFIPEEDLTNFYYKNKFDYIISLEVIEHLTEPRKLIELFYDLLKDNGRVLLTTPNHLYWKLRIKYLIGNIEAFEYPNKHFSFFSENSLYNLLYDLYMPLYFKKLESKLVYVGFKNVR